MAVGVVPLPPSAHEQDHDVRAIKVRGKPPNGVVASETARYPGVGVNEGAERLVLATRLTATVGPLGKRVDLLIGMHMTKTASYVWAAPPRPVGLGDEALPCGHLAAHVAKCAADRAFPLDWVLDGIVDRGLSEQHRMAARHLDRLNHLH